MRSITVAVVVLMGLQCWSEASACSRARNPGVIALTEDWREGFGQAFARASGVHLVSVNDAGKHGDGAWSMFCDFYDSGPPPLERRASKARKAEHEAELRRVEQASEACQAGRARVHVLETLKGRPLADWVEADAFITVADAPPAEPLKHWEDGTEVWGARLENHAGANCDGMVFSRRMSSRATYLVFTFEGDEPSPVITHAFLADDSAPFLAEARRLARPAP